MEGNLKVNKEIVNRKRKEEYKKKTSQMCDYIFSNGIESREDFKELIRKFNIVYIEQVSNRIYEYLKNLNSSMEENEIQLSEEFKNKVNKICKCKRIELILLATHVANNDPNIDEFIHHCKSIKISFHRNKKKIEEYYYLSNKMIDEIDHFKEIRERSLGNKKDLSVPTGLYRRYNFTTITKI